MLEVSHHLFSTYKWARDRRTHRGNFPFVETEMTQNAPALQVTSFPFYTNTDAAAGKTDHYLLEKRSLSAEKNKL